jgi:hypothetical protein
MVWSLLDFVSAIATTEALASWPILARSLLLMLTFPYFMLVSKEPLMKMHKINSF